MIRGSIAALVTPMNPAGQVDSDGVERLVDLHLREGTHALVVAGTTGECATLTFAEQIDLIRHVVALVQGRIPVIAGTGSNCTREAVELTAAAKAAGADACLLVTPYYIRPSQEGLYQHFRTIAESVAIAQILYNVPARTCCDLLPETVARLAKIGNIIGIKEATGDLRRARALLEQARDGFFVYSGDDASALELMLLGGMGNISVTANVVPRAMARLCEAALGGDETLARALDAPLQALNAALFIEPNPIAVKWALHRMGLIPKGIRLPMTWLAQHHETPLREALETCLSANSP
jgi:4-hydroxy-tetrahydrodipicolinate synthase